MNVLVNSRSRLFLKSLSFLNSEGRINAFKSWSVSYSVEILFLKAAYFKQTKLLFSFFSVKKKNLIWKVKKRKNSKGEGNLAKSREYRENIPLDFVSPMSVNLNWERFLQFSVDPSLF